MKLKRTFLILLGIALILSMAGSVAADTAASSTSSSPAPENNYYRQTHSSTTTLLYTVSAERFTMTIPGQINFHSDLNWTAYLNATDITLASGRTLEIAVNSTHGYLLVQHSGGAPLTDKNISYQMEYTLPGEETAVANKDRPGKNPLTLVEAPAGTVEYIVPLKFTMTGEPPQLGTYQDILTFSASVSGNIPSPATDTPTPTPTA